MTDGNPYERKVQLTGGTTYTVSLPKEWANDHALEMGSRVHLYTRGDRLLVTQPAADDAARQVTIAADRHDPAGLTRLVAGAYVSGAEVVRIEGALDRESRAAVREAVTSLLGMQVAEETDRALVVRTMLDVDDLSPKQTLAQLERVALTMHESAVEAALAGDADGGRRVAAQDDSVDRLFALVAREFQRSLVDVSVDRAGAGLTTFDYYHAARQLERVADHAAKIGGVAELVTSPPSADVVGPVREVADDSRGLVRRALSTLLTDRDPETLGRIVAEADTVAERAEALDRDVHDRDLTNGYALTTVLDSVRRTAEYGVNVAEGGLQASLRDRDAESVTQPNG